MNSCHVLRIATCIAVMAAAAAPSRTASAQGLPSDSASTLRLTLEDAVRRAVDHNPDLAIVRLDRETALMRVAESRGAFVPLFSTTLGRSGDVTPPSNSLFGERGVIVNDWFSSTGVRQRLPWGGGTWNVSWDASRTTTNNPLSSFRAESGVGHRARLFSTVVEGSYR